MIKFNLLKNKINFSFYKTMDKVVELVGGEYVINGATPLSLFRNFTFSNREWNTLSMIQL